MDTASICNITFALLGAWLLGYRCLSLARSPARSCSVVKVSTETEVENPLGAEVSPSAPTSGMP